MKTSKDINQQEMNLEYPTPLADIVADVAAKNSEIESDGDDDNSEDGSESGSDSESWEDSGDEAWPAEILRYAPIGDPYSNVSRKGSPRMAQEFTMGAGFHHLNEGGNRAMFTLPANTILPPPATCVGLSHYNKAAIALMDKHNLKEIGLRVSKQTYLDKVLLVTDAPYAIRLYVGDDSGPCIMGIALIRDDIMFTSGILSEQEPPLTLKLDPGHPVLDSIEMQSCTWLEGKDRVEKKITYLRLSCGPDTLVFGQMHTPGFDGKQSIYSKVESAAGNLCITGIGYFDNKPVTLQVVDLGLACEDVVDAMNTCVYYNNGVISGNKTQSRAPEVEFLGSITTEDDAVWNTLLGCMDAVENSSPSYGELLPNAVNLLEHSLGGDVHTMHSVFRIDRFLTHIIQERKTIKTFENDHLNFYSKLIPMKQMWGIFSNAIERIKRVHGCEPTLNSFNVAFLQGTEESFKQAIFVFLTQIIMLILTSSHIWKNRADFHIQSLLHLAVSICGTVVVNSMAKQSRENFDDFANIFPQYIGTTLYKIDAFSNIFSGFLVTICTFLLLMMTSDNLDIVLNATALLFVLELDEVMIDNNPIWVTSLYRAHFMKDIIKELNESDKRYWDPEYLRKDRGEHYRIHTPSCSFLFPSK